GKCSGGAPRHSQRRGDPSLGPAESRRRDRGNRGRAILASPAFADAADQRRSHVPPKRLREREAKIASIEADVLEHVIIEPREKLEIAAVTGVSSPAHA